MSSSRSEILAQSVGARICHDLINPLGAVGNGVELLGLSTSENSVELELLQSSVNAAQARLQMLRIAFGPTTDEAIVEGHILRTLMTQLSNGQRHKIEWLPSSGTPRNVAQLGTLMVLCVVSAMPTGGHIRVVKIGDYSVVEVTATRIDLDPIFWDHIAEPAGLPAPSARTVHFNLLADQIKQTGRVPQIELMDNGFVFSVRPT
ncbi:MAG: histidine phosphotransferase family protein [Pseudoruegeria sp.]